MKSSVFGQSSKTRLQEEAFRQSLRINPEYAQAWFNLGITYAATGNRTDALETVRELRRLDPKQADELFNLIVPR